MWIPYALGLSAVISELSGCAVFLFVALQSMSFCCFAVTNVALPAVKAVSDVMLPASNAGHTCGLLAIPLQPWTGPEGSRSLRLPDFKTVGT
jgi:hypothetical protein